MFSLFREMKITKRNFRINRTLKLMMSWKDAFTRYILTNSELACTGINFYHNMNLQLSSICSDSLCILEAVVLHLQPLPSHQSSLATVLYTLTNTRVRLRFQTEVEHSMLNAGQYLFIRTYFSPKLSDKVTIIGLILIFLFIL